MLRPHCRSGRIVLYQVLLFATIGFFAPGTWIARPVLAQVSTQSGLERYGAVTPEKRAELYRTLREQSRALEAQSAVVKTVAKLVGPTVVHVKANISDQRALPHRGHTRQVEEEGSGVIAQWKGRLYVLTNRHVISGAPPAEINILLADGRNIHPTKVWGDKETDVAVLAVSTSGLIAAPIGNSDLLDIGDFVLAVGSPYGLTHSVTFGIVSAKGRRNLALGTTGVRFQDFIQTDAAINPGNSGGPLINLHGEVVGINTCIASNSGGSEGIGFAIPVNMFMTIARQLIETGKVTRAFLGVTLDAHFNSVIATEVGLPRPIGTRITEITPDSPAQKAGLLVGDVILQFNGKMVEDDDHLVNMVSLTEIGKPVPVIIFRNRKSVRINVAVGDRSLF